MKISKKDLEQRVSALEKTVIELQDTILLMNKIQENDYPFDISQSFNGIQNYLIIRYIDKGKVKRSVAEQATLQFNSLLKNYLDKGYVKLSGLTTKKYSELSEDEIKNLLGGNFVSDQSGIPKPMLAKLADQCSSDIWEKNWFVSRKLDGEPKSLCRL